MAKRAGDSRISKSSTGEADRFSPEIEEHRERLADAIGNLPRKPPEHLTGRGIVTAIGGRHIASGWVCLTLLREEHGCRLPIEVWHLGDVDFPPHLRRLFERFDVTFVDGTVVARQYPMQELTGWTLKPLAIAHSRFAEVLWIDADNVPLAEPTYLFNDPRYRRSGAIFWADIRQVNPYNPIWRICNLEPPEAPEWESGQVLLNKRHHWRALQLTLHFNAWSTFYFRYVLGDKDTFHLAWRILDARFDTPDVPPVAATNEPVPGGRHPTAALALWQYDLSGRPLFLHRPGAEWVPYGRNVVCDGFDPHQRCLAALDELREVWDGHLHPPPAPAAKQEHELAGYHRAFRYVRLGVEDRELHLHPDERVGRGAQEEERFWREEQTDGERCLILSSRDGDTCRLLLHDDGVWRGKWLSFEQTPVELIPLASTVADQTGPRRLLYVTPVIPADGGNGLAMRAAHVLKILCRHYRVSLLVVPRYASGAAGGELPRWVAEQCEDVRWAQPPVPSSALDAGDPLQMLAWKEEAGRAYPDDAFDIIHVFRLAAFDFAEPYLSRLKDRAVEWHLDLDDVESRTFERIQKLGGVTPDQPASLTAAERQILREWDRVYVCSEVDREHLKAELPEHRAEIVVLPNAVAAPEQVEPAPRTSPITLLFVGTFGYLPNADAAVWFCREVLPVIREMTPLPVRLLLVGTGSSEDVRRLRYIPEVELIGPVPKIEQWYRQADIVVVPLRAGGGTRIKILEALAHRRPVVSTSIGAEGLDLMDEREILIADRPHHFARQCLRLVGDGHLAQRLAEQGRTRILRDYTPDAVLEQVSARL